MGRKNESEIKKMITLPGGGRVEAILPDPKVSPEEAWRDFIKTAKKVLNVN